VIRRYATPLAFKQALEQRIKSSSATGTDFARRRQLLVFDRFLARVVSVVGDAVLRLYPVVSHIAEKLHALTMPMSRPNTRVRDLPDIALLATTGPINEVELRLAFERTFRFRGTHSLPTSVPAPPSFWEGPYAAMAGTDELIWRTLAEVTEAVSSFLNPLLGVSPDRRIWVPADWRWRSRP
jgi:hypothetical protein